MQDENTYIHIYILERVDGQEVSVTCNVTYLILHTTGRRGSPESTMHHLHDLKMLNYLRWFQI